MDEMLPRAAANSHAGALTPNDRARVRWRRRSFSRRRRQRWNAALFVDAGESVRYDFRPDDGIGAKAD
jgi:hypothetical protein